MLLRSLKLGPTLRTARFLRPSQLLARAAFVAERRLDRARPGLLTRRYARRLQAILTVTTDADPLWRWPPAPLDPAARAEPARAAEIMDDSFTFLNQTRTVRDWSAPGASRLWLFHLHGFAYAVDLAVAARRGLPGAGTKLELLVASWLAAHAVEASSDAWHPFVVSDRLIAWLVARDLWPALAQPVRAPILLHALYLERHFERDVGGNHLLKNLVALLLAGCAFDGAAPERWRTRASAALERELRRQVLPDGGHYERSPMYHLLVLADLLTALFPAGKRELPISVPLAEAVRRMQGVALTLRHGDGEIPLFNDAVLGEAPPPARLVGPSTPPARDCLRGTGYAVLRVGGGALIMDCGAPGPDDLPAHVHADALSFELSLGSQRVFVNSGVYEYSAGLLRDRLRGTAAHNTVQVDGADQTEVWSAFRVGRRARVDLERCSADLVIASHDGYQRLGVRHERRVDAVPGVGWRVLDLLIGHGRHEVISRLRLHPALRWDRCLVRDEHDRPLLEVRPIGHAKTELERGMYAERFSTIQDIDVLRLTRTGAAPILFGYWLLFPGAEPALI